MGGWGGAEPQFPPVILLLEAWAGMMCDRERERLFKEYGKHR